MDLFNVYPLYDIAPVKGKNVYVYDQEGTEFLDLYGGHAVISIGHSHPQYVSAITEQVGKLGFYSNSIINPLQKELADRLERLSGISDYSLFLCNSGAEANENALKLASFHTGKSRTVYFSKSFHGRTSATVAVTDNPNIQAPLNTVHLTSKLDFGDYQSLEKELKKGDVAAVIVEVIQGVGGLEEASTEFYKKASELCRQNGALLIADEVQAGYGRTGDFFAFQKHGIRPDIISIAKGMGNGFPVGGILIDAAIQPKMGMLGTTFGGNHLACAACISVLKVLEEEELMANARSQYEVVAKAVKDIPQIKALKGRGLMLGLEFDFPVADLRKELLFQYKIFTGASSNKNQLRILPPLSIGENHFRTFFDALKKLLKKGNFQ